jgi:tetratricopeptide (TPR) repeat protein
MDLTQADPAVRAALQSARDAVQRQPQSAAAWGRLGMLLAAHAFYPESAVCFTEAERLDPEELRWPYFQGVILTLGDPDAALPHLRRALELAKANCAAPRLRLAEVLLGQGQPAAAEELLRQVLAHDPDSALAHLGLGRVAFGRNAWSEGLAHLEAAASSPLTRKRARALLAEVYRRRGDEAAAENERRLADDLPPDPGAPDPFLEELDRLRVGRQAELARASRLLKQGEVEQAVALLGRLVRSYPESASAWLGLGRALVQQQRYPAAEQALRQAARFDSGRVETQFYLGVALFQQGRTGDAAGHFRRATELRPDYALAWYNLGQCLKAGGDRTGAIDAFGAAVRYQPHHAEAHANLSELLVEEGRRDLALRHLRQAVELNPADTHARGLLKRLDP